MFAGGALAAFAAPSILQATALAGPLADAVTLGAAGAVDLVALVVAVTLPHALAPARAAEMQRRAQQRRLRPRRRSARSHGS